MSSAPSAATAAYGRQAARRLIEVTRRSVAPTAFVCFVEGMDHDKFRREEAPTQPEAGASSKRRPGSAEATEGRKSPSSKAETARPPKPAKSGVTPKAVKAPEDPEDYSDPICVCEPEPYWQEVAERMEREARASK